MAARGAKPRRGAVVWSSAIAYAVGLLATDGCLSSDGRHIDLTSQDRQQLKNFMRCIGKDVKVSHKISSFTRKKVTHIQFSDVGLYRFLLSIGLTPRKTHTLGRLEVPDEYFFDFLRGHHDGDGSFYSYFDPRWKNSFMFYLACISASKTHVNWIQETVERLSGARGHLTYTGREGHKVYSLRYAKEDSLRVLRRMYADSRAVCLARKKLKISRALGIVGLTLP